MSRNRRTPPQPKKTLGLADAVLAHYRAEQRAKRAYKVKDAMLDQVLLQCEPGTVIETPKGKFVLKNQFAGKHKAFKTTHFEQFVLELVK